MEGAWTRIMHSVQLTSSGRMHLQQGEVECQLVDAVDLDCEGGAGWTLKTGLLTLTTHRLLWLDEKGKKAWAVPLGAVGQLYAVKKSIKSMFAAPRMRFQAWTQRDGKLATHGQRVAELVLTLVFRGQSGVPDGFVQRFAEVLQAKAWQQKRLEESPSGGHKGAGSSLEASVHKRPTVSTLNPAMAGVSGILRKEQEQWEETDKNLHDAFQDLNGLMSKAKEMVILAEKMRVRLLTGQASTVEEEGVGTNQEMQDWMLSVGITSPVTKESAGALYHQQLSRQLADFVREPLKRSGGMLAMVDAYCLFNRARGTELISPEDLLQACTIWQTLDVPVRLRKFDSGVMVIQSKSQSDDEVFLRLTMLVSNGEAEKLGVSAAEAARALGMAPALAREQLLAAEGQGLLCRDDGVDGLRFFSNFFKDINASTIFQES
ncbi:unnamed protein product [Sphagnum jensenii]|uniref:Vacuolar protein-sorting-associated protein 36 n=1 Tax=Sphagnum jensenii TaxID=128206 RepID=A0ABP1B2T1_9BRYO